MRSDASSRTTSCQSDRSHRTVYGEGSALPSGPVVDEGAARAARTTATHVKPDDQHAHERRGAQPAGLEPGTASLVEQFGGHEGAVEGGRVAGRRAAAQSSREFR